MTLSDSIAIRAPSVKALFYQQRGSFQANINADLRILWIAGLCAVNLEVGEVRALSSQFPLRHRPYLLPRSDNHLLDRSALGLDPRVTGPGNATSNHTFRNLFNTADS